MNTPLFGPIVSHELKLLARNTLMWFRFAIFYVVFATAIGRLVHMGEWERATITLVGLIVLASVGIASALSAEAFAQEKDRGTMEALLLVPMSASALLRAKLLYVCAAAMFGVLFSLATGFILVVGLSDAAITAVVNRTTVSTAFLVCPPSIIIAGSLGTIISCRARSLQNATTAATLSSIAGLLVVVFLAYTLAIADVVATLIVTLATWLAALLTYRITVSAVNPQVMIRTRGR